METISEESTGASEISLSPVSKLVDPLGALPLTVAAGILEFLPIKDLLQARLICKSWNCLVITEDLLYHRSCFTFDGRKDDPTGTKCCSYMEESETKNSLWDFIRLRRANARQIAWANSGSMSTYVVTTFELLNCTINWLLILQILMELENLRVFIDVQNTYNWDYATFNAGIDEEESIFENERFLGISAKEKLNSLSNIRIVHIHRSQLSDCTTYIKMLSIKCTQLEELTFTTDQNFQPQRAIPMYRNLALLTQKNNLTLRALNFPFKNLTAAYDFRLTDEHHNFREFLNFIFNEQWCINLAFPALKELSLQFGIIPVEANEIRNKLTPFIDSLSNLSTFSLGCLFVEPEGEPIIQELIKDKRYQTKLGVLINDTTGTVPIFSSSYVEHSLQSLVIQTFRPVSKEVKDTLPLLGIDVYENIKEFQYFNKNHTFCDFNVDLLICSLANVTHLNLVDHNSRIETRHSSEAIAIIEDVDMQLILRNMTQLISMQIVGNLTYLTNCGMTGFTQAACTRIRKSNVYIKLSGDVEGLPVHSLKYLETFVLRGLGIKVTDITIRMAFVGMTYLKKLHLYGSHQISAASRMIVSQQFPASRGCDLQV